MVSNLTNLTGAVNFYDIIVFTNQVTGDLVTMLFMVVIFFILFNQFIKRYSFEESFMVSSFLCFGLSIMFAAISLLNFWFIIFFGAFTALSAFYNTMTKK